MPNGDADTVDLIVLVGIQASGKTTFYRRHLEADYSHVSLDNWRGKGNVRRKEHQAIMAALAAAAESSGKVRGVVVDNTNITAETRKRYFEYADEFSRGAGRPVQVIACFFDPDVQNCLDRNRQRPKDTPPGVPYHVPPAAIRSFHRRLEPPTHKEGFDEIFRVRITEEGGFLVEDAARPRPDDCADAGRADIEG